MTMAMAMRRVDSADKKTSSVRVYGRGWLRAVMELADDPDFLA
jgi:hypothetical protein